MPSTHKYTDTRIPAIRDYVEKALARTDIVSLTRAQVETLLRNADPPSVPTYQEQVGQWMTACFPPDVINDLRERGDRFLEEALEYLQAHGYDQTRVEALTRYVYGRPVGEPMQELGGVMVTLAAHANTAGLDMVLAGVCELQRINDPETIQKIRIKQASKKDIHGPLP